MARQLFPPVGGRTVRRQGVTAQQSQSTAGSDLPALLADLARAGVTLRRLDGARLQVRAPRGRLTAGLQARIAERKPELLQWLGEASSEHLLGALEEVRPDPDGLHQPFLPSDLQISFLIGSREGLEHHVRPHQYLEFDFPELDPERFQAAVDRAVERQRRNLVVLREDMMLEVVGEPGPVRVGVSDWRGAADPESVPGIAEVRAAMQRHELPLHSWPWLQLHISRYGEGRARLHYNNNNFFSDAIGTLKLLDSVLHYYHRPDQPLPELELSYRDCVLTLAELEESPRGRASQRYWTERIPDWPDAPRVPLSPGADTRRRSRLSRRELVLPAAAWTAFRERAAAHGLTPTNALYAGYAEVLATWSGSRHFLLNNMITHRLPIHPQIRDIVGNFASLYPLEVDWRHDETFAGRALRLQRQVMADLDHVYWSGVKVLQRLNQQRSTPGRAACPFAIASALASDPIDRPVHSVLETPQVLLDCEIFGLADGSLWVVWDAIEEMFPAGLVDEMHAGFRLLLDRLAAGDAWLETAIDLLPAAQRARRAELNRATDPVPAGLLHDPLAGQATAAADRTAVVTADSHLSYAELDRRVDQLAGRLAAAGTGPGDLVAVALPKGWEQVVAVFAALRAGAAYVPVDPAWPIERIRYVLADAAARAVVSDPAHAANLAAAAGCPVLALTPDPERAGPERAGPEPTGPPDAAPAGPPPRRAPADLAYVIYTSGSTGRPKGAMLDHRGPLNTIADVNRRFGVGPADRIFGISSLCFDLSVYDIFGAVAAGATLVLPTDAERNPASWASTVARESVTVWNSVPAVADLLVEEAESTGRTFPHLRLVLLSGDWIPVTLPDRIRRVAPNAQVVSLGGATEASIWSIFYPVGDVPGDLASIPYGRPLANQSWHVLDGSGRDAPVWVPGDLYIGGVGLALGYLNDPVRTQAAFVTHPRTGERLYRTGDLGRYLPDGDLEFLGRADHQVKIQGFRVEPGEIEHALLEHPAVRQAVVVARDSGSGKQLTGFVAVNGHGGSGDNGSNNGGPGDNGSGGGGSGGGRGRPGPGHLSGFLADRLPAYLVPDSIVVLDRLPLSGNGKLDRAALTALVPAEAAQEREFTAPRSPLEATVAAAWAEILDTGPVGVHDDFFDIGGQSFAGLRVVALLSRRLGVPVPLGLLLEHRTVAGMAAALQLARPGRSPLVRLTGPAPRPTGGRPPPGLEPLFLVHPAGGYVLRYRDLPDRIGRPCLALQAVDPPADQRRPETVAGFAEQYLRAVDDAGLAAPALLGGWSSGAVIAHEMAAQLEGRGVAVDGLLVLDSPAPTRAREVPETTVLLWFLDDLDLGFDPDAVPAEAVRRLAATPQPQRLARAIELVREQGIGHAPLDPDILAPTFEVFRRVVRACEAYRPPRIAAGVAVVRASTGRVQEFAGHPAGDRADWGWSELTTGHVVTGSAPGTHHTLLAAREPDRLAATVHDLLRRLGDSR
jgi:amino acid adenylation domain-containing protein